MLRMTRYASAVASFLCAVAVVITGCGSSSKTPPPSAAATSASTTPAASAEPTKAQFIAQADRICRESSKSLAATDKRTTSAVRAEEAADTSAHRDSMARGFKDSVALARPGLDRLRGLAPPAEDRVVVAKYLSARDHQLTLADSFASALANNDASMVSTLATQLKEGKATLQGLAQGYGFKECSSGK